MEKLLMAQCEALSWRGFCFKTSFSQQKFCQLYNLYIDALEKMRWCEPQQVSDEYVCSQYSTAQNFWHLVDMSLYTYVTCASVLELTPNQECFIA